MSAKTLISEKISAHARPYAAFAVSVAFAVTALPALAQQQAAPNLPVEPHRYGPMVWGGHWGWHPFFMIGPIIVLLAIIGAMAIFVWLVRWATRGHPFYGHGFGRFHGRCPWHGGPPRGRALDILEERFAKGEIDKAEFEEKRKLLAQ